MRRKSVAAAIVALAVSSGADSCVKVAAHSAHPDPSRQPIRIVFAGDAMMDGSVKSAIRRRGSADPYKQVKQDVRTADWAVVNLETSVTRATEKDPNQWFNFKSNPEALGGLRNAGFDMVSLGNNHVLDYGRDGLRDTLGYLRRYGLAYVGAGANENEAYEARSIRIRGQVIKIAAFSRFMPTLDWTASGDRSGVASAYDQARVVRAIREQSAGADYFIVYMHWGVERNNHPEAWQRLLARRMIDAGADAVVGSHPHVLQGFEFYKSKPIAYSIGNFLFPDYVRGRRADTGLLKLTLLDGSIGMRFDPYYILDNRIVRRGAAYERDQLNYLQNLSFGVRMSGHTVSEWPTTRAKYD
ncbi:CapA family protein [Cohnella nanjingensis]|uniref:CapA family protein n=1 Tax=Cohnella nanjingensis TaxID=1387779 RepID=UPI001FE34DD1|nr:CapA family protein [Cohnella nanjingensis]